MRSLDMRRPLLKESQLARAWRDTKFRPIGEIGAAVCASLISWMFFPETERLGAVSAFVIGAIAGAVVFPLIEFIFHLLNAPVRQRDEARALVEQLDEANEELRASKISFRIETKNFFLPSPPSTNETAIGFGFKAKVFNVGDKPSVSEFARARLIGEGFVLELHPINIAAAQLGEVNGVPLVVKRADLLVPKMEQILPSGGAVEGWIICELPTSDHGRLLLAESLELEVSDVAGTVHLMETDIGNRKGGPGPGS